MQFDEIYGKYRSKLQWKVELYRDKLDSEDWECYQRSMAEFMDEPWKTLTEIFEDQLTAFVKSKIEHIQGMVSVKG